MFNFFVSTIHCNILRFANKFMGRIRMWIQAVE
jgi:hypothetical protein